MKIVSTNKHSLKLVTLLISILLLLSVIGFSTGGQRDKFYPLRGTTYLNVIPSSQIVEFGDTFSIIVHLIPGEPVFGVQISVFSFDPSLVQAVSVVKADPYWDFFQAGTINNTQGRITGAAAAKMGSTVSTPIDCFNITFVAQNTAGTSPLTLESVVVLNATGTGSVASLVVNNGSVTVVGTPNQPPVALFGFEPSSPSTGDLVYLNSTSYDPDGVIVNWTWDMDDGTVRYGEQVTHQYATSGVYTVTLTVMDDDGDTGYVQHDITVYETNTILSVIPSSQIVGFGDTFSIIVHLIPGEPVFGVELSVFSFDPSLVQAVSVVKADPYWTFFQAGTIDNTQGRITGAAAAQLGSAVSTPIDCFNITFTAKNTPGTSPLNLQSVLVLNASGTGSVASLVVNSGAVTVVGTPNQPPVALFGFEPSAPSTGDLVYLNSTSYDPDGVIVNWTWDMDDGTVRYGEQVTHQYATSGVYTVTLTVMDDDGDTGHVQHQITVYHVYLIAVKPSWNLISIPVYDTIQKTNIQVKIGDEIYTWSEASNPTDPIILNTVYQWTRGSGPYTTTDTVAPGEGYWVWAYEECELLIKSSAQPPESGHITDLLENWNIMGLPYNTALDKTTLKVFVGTTEYTWQQAVDQIIILEFIYGWDKVNQIYQLMDTLTPGEGYWMYAYENCTLKKGG